MSVYSNSNQIKEKMISLDSDSDDDPSYEVQEIVANRIFADGRVSIS